MKRAISKVTQTVTVPHELVSDYQRLRRTNDNLSEVLINGRDLLKEIDGLTEGRDWWMDSSCHAQSMAQSLKRLLEEAVKDSASDEWKRRVKKTLKAYEKPPIIKRRPDPTF